MSTTCGCLLESLKSTSMVCGTTRSFRHIIWLKSRFLLNNPNLFKVLLVHLAIIGILANSPLNSYLRVH